MCRNRCPRAEPQPGESRPADILGQIKQAPGPILLKMTEAAL